MKEVLKRLQSPIVIAQIVSILGSLVVALNPDTIDVVDKIVYSITIIINVFAGINNPADKESF